MTARLQLEAATSCATWSELVTGVARRSSRVRLVTTVATRSLFASLRPAADGSLVVELVVVNEGGRRSQRRLTAPSCAEALEALALVIAVTLDPASVAEHPGGATAPGSAGAASSPQPAEAKADAPRSNSTKNGPARPDSDEPDAAPQRASGGEGRRLSWRVGAALVAASGPAPQLLPGFGLSLLAGWEAAGPWSPAVRISAAHYWLNGLREAGGTADFELDAGSLDLCALRWGEGWLAIRACVNAQAGRMLASGSRTFSPRSKSRPFVVLGGSTLLTASLPVGLEAGASLGVGCALIDDEYVFANQAFYRVPRLSLGFGLGLGYRFR